MKILMEIRIYEFQSIIPFYINFTRNIEKFLMSFVVYIEVYDELWICWGLSVLLWRQLLDSLLENTLLFQKILSLIYILSVCILIPHDKQEIFLCLTNFVMYIKFQRIYENVHYYIVEIVFYTIEKKYFHKLQ